ncbi:MAG: flippase-like domain-containing protein [Firmicutes bacterium]|nr:flippase-like domain-containing protein [Bacillota bacterium]
MGEEQQPTRRSPAQLRRSAAIGVVFSIIGLYVVLKLTGGYQSWQDLARIDPMMLGVACGLVVITWLLDSLRMRALIRSLGGDLSVLGGMRISIMGAFVSSVTPFDSGGEPVQAYLLTEIGLNAGQSSAVIAVKTLCNALARFTLGVAASIWLFCLADFWSVPRGMYYFLSFGILLYFAVFVFSVYLVSHPEKISIMVVPMVRNRFTSRLFKVETLDTVLARIEHELLEFGLALQDFIDNKRSTLWTVMALSYAWWITITIVPAVILVGLGMRPRFIRVMGITLLFYLAAAYAPTPGSSGAAELGFGVLFSSVVPQGLIGLFVTVWRVFTYYLNLLVGGILMSFGFARKKSVTQDHHQTTDKVSHDV